MNSSEAIAYNPRQHIDLQRLVQKGEGLHLEFKRKAAYPEKVIRELIAFANTEGGILLIGVDDDGGIPGVKYPEEEIVVLLQALNKYCRPAINFSQSILSISAKRFVVRFDISASPRRPHFYVTDKEHKECYVRVNDMSVKASREVAEIVRRSRQKKDIRFSFGESEKRLMEYLEEKGAITLNEFRAMAGLNRFLAARKLILLVLANVLRITPTERGDLYSRI